MNNKEYSSKDIIVFYESLAEGLEKLNMNLNELYLNSDIKSDILEIIEQEVGILSQDEKNKFSSIIEDKILSSNEYTEAIYFNLK